MHNGKSSPIRVSPVPDASGRYVAVFRSQVLDADFSVVFHETITGAVALHTFAEMLRKQYGYAVEIVLPDATFGLPKSSAVRDVLDALNKPPVGMVS